MPYRQDLDTGEWIEVDAQGNPVSRGQIIANPTAPYDVPKAAADASNAGANAEVNQATVPQQIRKSTADATAAERGAATAGLPEGFMWAPDGNTAIPIPGYSRQGLSPEIRSQAIQAFSDADALERAADEIERLFQAGPGATSGLAGFKDYLPTTANKVFNDAGQQARGYVKRALGFTGGEGNTVAESSALYDPYLPSAGDRDEQIVAKIAKLRSLAEDARLKSMRTLGGVPDAAGNIVPVPEGRPNALTIPRVVAGGGPAAAGAGATTTLEQLPPAYQQAYEAFARAGGYTPEQYADFRASLDRQFFPDAAPDRETYIAEGRRILDTLEKGGTLNLTVPGVERELSDVGLFGTGAFSEQARNNAVSNPIAAGFLGAVDMGSFGGLRALEGDRLDALADANPLAMAAGQIGGSLGGTTALARGVQFLAKRTPIASRLLGGGAGAQFGRNVATDAGYGGIYGGVSEGDPVGDAAMSAAGSMAGQGLGRGVGRAIGGIDISPAAQRLKDAGIRLTVGRQLGDTASRIEDNMASWPFVGDAVRRRSQDSFEDLSGAMFREGGAPIGFRPSAIGREGVEQFRTAKGNAYDAATEGAMAALDPQFEDDLVGVATLRNQLPEELRPRFDRLMENHTAGVQESGFLSGEAYQRAMRGLKTARGKAGTVAGEFEEPYREAVSAGMDAFDGLMRRGGGEDVVQGLNAANAANKNFKIIEDAVVTRARNGTRSGEVGLPAPSQFVDAAAASERRYGASPLRSLAEDAQRVLPSSLPNSGTTDRALAAGLGLAGLGAIGGGEAYTTGGVDNTAKLAAALALLTAGGTRGGQKALQKVLIDRGPRSQMIGRQIRNRAGLFGSASLPLLIAN